MQGAGQARPQIDGEPLISGGVCVSPGIAAGPVTWVRSDREALKVKDGAVLALEHPDPRWASLLDLSPKIPPLASLVNGTVIAAAGADAIELNIALMPSDPKRGADEIEDSEMPAKTDAFHQQCTDCHSGIGAGPEEKDCSECHVQ